LIPPSGDAQGGVRLFLKTPVNPVNPEVRDRRVVTPPGAADGRRWGSILWAIDVVLVILAFAQLLSGPKSDRLNLSLMTGASLIGLAGVVGVIGLYLRRFLDR
jgi:hypothetical protein